MFEYRVLGTIDEILPLTRGELLSLEHRPDLDFKDLERVKDKLCDRVGAAARQVSTNPSAESLHRLAYVDRLTVIVIERIDAARGSPDPASLGVFSLKECPQRFADLLDFGGWFSTCIRQLRPASRSTPR
jgi:hypothetical protein